MIQTLNKNVQNQLKKNIHLQLVQHGITVEQKNMHVPLNLDLELKFHTTHLSLTTEDTYSQVYMLTIRIPKSK